MGHTEGITYVSAKGDGRYVISNGKDQALRLWDLRKMRTNAEHEAVERNHYGIPNFNYMYCISFLLEGCVFLTTLYTQILGLHKTKI
jgi:WD40 repeat protein